jgi:hypothetical protein
LNIVNFTRTGLKSDIVTLEIEQQNKVNNSSYHNYQKIWKVTKPTTNYYFIEQCANIGYSRYNFERNTIFQIDLTDTGAIVEIGVNGEKYVVNNNTIGITWNGNVVYDNKTKLLTINKITSNSYPNMRIIIYYDYK